MRNDSDSAPDARGEAEPKAYGSRPLLVGLILAVMLHAIDELAIATALPLIARDLDGASLYGVAFAAYLLASLISIVWSGHLTDEKGPTLPFVCGLIVFAIGLVLGALATSMEVFVLARAVQGLGGGVFSAVVFASVNKAWPDHQRARIMALLSAAWVIPGLVAPAAAGAIAEFWSWRWIFILLLPFVAITALLSLKGLRAIPAGEAHDTGSNKTLDAVRIAAGVALALTAISGVFDLMAAALLLAGIVISAGPFQRVLPPGEGAQRRNLLAALGMKMALVFAFFGADAFLPLGLIEIHGLTAFGAGLVLTLASLTWSGAAFVQARLASRVSPQYLATSGTVLVSLSILGLISLSIEGAPYWISYLFWTLAGAGTGLAYNTATTSAMAHTLEGKEGATATASGLAEALAFSMASGIGGAILNYGNRNAVSLEVSIGIIWLMCATAMAGGVVVAWRFLETKARST